MNFQKKRIQFLLFVTGLIALSITARTQFHAGKKYASPLYNPFGREGERKEGGKGKGDVWRANPFVEKCRQLVGEQAASKSGQFTFLNCFDGGSGTVSCAVKESVKIYFYNIRASHVERARNQAIEGALVDALSQGLTPKDAAKQAQKEGEKAAKLATRQAKRIIGPIISSGWDFFEAIYFGGTMTEGFLRGTGTLVGTYAGGFLGEQRFGRFGYLVGSELGSWVGGRIGLMGYDVVNGVHYLLQFTQPEETKVFETAASDSAEASEDSYVYETPTYMSSETSEDSNFYESPVYESSEAHEDF